MRKFKLFFACLLMAVLSIGQMWAEDVTGTINFGSGSSCTNVNATSVSGDDSQGNTWTVTTAGTSSFTPSANYAQIGSSKKPASSITFTTTLAEDQEITSFSAKFGGFSGTQGAVTLKVDDTTVGTGSLNATSDVIVENSSSETGKVLTVTVTGIAKGVKAYYISYTYSTGGGDTPPTPKTLESVSVSGTPTKTSYFAGQDFDPAGLTVTGHYSDDTNAEITTGITWSYNPAQELAENQTSIKVKATVSDITSEDWFTVSGLTVVAGPDVFIDLVDAGWGLPTTKVVAENSYTNGDITIKLAGSTGNGYRVYTGSNIILGKQDAYLELPAFASPIARIVVAGNSGGSGKVTWNIFKGNAAVSTAVTGCTNDAYTFEIDPLEANVVYRIKVTNDNNLQMKNIQIFFGEAPVVTKPSISGETPFLNSTNVSISIPEGTTVYYTTDGSDPKTAGTQYSAAFDLNNSATVKAIATDGVNWSEVAEKAFTKATVMTVAEARTAINAGGDLSNKFVAGIISQIDSYNSTYNSITYWISDDGTTTNQLQVYSGLAGVVKSAFASKDDLAVGDDVTVKGTLKKYQSTYEFDYNNTIEAYKPIARLAWSAESYDASLEGTNTFPTLTNTYSVDVTYSSSDAAKASFDDASVYDITLNAVGTVTITATFAGNETYKANAVSYEMSIASSLVTLTYNVDGGEAIDPVNVNALPNPLPTTTKAGKNFGGWFTDPEKEVAAVPGAAISENTTLYAKWLDPYTVAEAKTVIDATPAGTENQYVAGIISQIDSYNGTYKSITYWISADGTTTNQLQVYGGLIGNAATALKKDYFTQEEDLKLGDQVVVKGTLKKYNSTYEFDKNNTIYSFNRPAPKYTVRLWNTAEGWSTVNAHVWNNDGNVTEWPGEATTFKAGWNEFKVEEGNSLLFCKADGSAQTVDIKDVTADACYVLTGEADGSGHLEVALDTECADRFYVAGNTELTGENWNAAGARLQNGSVTFTNVPAGDHQFKVTNGSWNWERGYLAFDSENSNVTNWGDNNVGFTTKSAKDITITYDEANNKITVTTVDYVEPTYKAIVVAYGDKYYAMTTNFDGGGFTPLAVKVDANGNVLVQTEAERNSILWKYTADTEKATFQDANNQYLAKGSGNTGLALATTDAAAEWTWNSDGGYYYVTSDRTFLYQGEGNIFKNYATSNASATGYSDLPVFYEAAKVIVSNTATLKFFAPVAWETVKAYTWEGTYTGDHAMTAVAEGSRWFECEIEKGVPFLIYNGTWNGSNQTANIDAIDADKCFAWTAATDSEGKIIATEITSCEMNYFISGDEALTGVAEWGHKALAANNTVAFSEVAADTYHFKITNGSWAWNLGAAYLDETACQNVTIEETDANGNVVFTIDNPSDITIAYNPATEKISVVATAVTPKEYYTKVTSTADLTAGYYLIVSEDNLLEEHVALNGELSTLDATNNVIDVEIVTGKGIEVTDATNAAAFFIDPEIGTIKSASGLFIGRTGNSNGLNQSENIYAYENAFSFDEDGNADIMIGSLKLRYNSASNQNRFRYFTSAQQTIQLYKKAEAAKASPELAFAQSEVQGLKGNVIASNLTNEHNVPVTYVSSATTYASVDEEGNVTLKKAGNVTIYAVTAGDETYRESYAKYTITINDFGSYTRPVTPDNYGTICLPKAGVMTGATLFEIGSYENNIIYVDEVNGGAMEAGKPYIFQATSDQLNVAYTSNVEVAAGENNGLHGFYNLENENAQFNIPADEGNYILYQNQYWLVSGRPAYIANYRAYIRVSEINYVAPAPGRRRVAMNVNGEQTATGINELNAAEAPVKMIMDGQLYILRGEKLYNANGQIVK